MPKTTTTEAHALLICADGAFRVIDWPGTSANALKTLYSALGCGNVAAVDMSDKLTMWLDDEGIINGSPANRPATFLYALYQAPHQVYYGDAVITGGTDRHGNTRGLTRDQLCELIEQHLMTTDVFIPAQRTD
ncbi:DUF3846 domain-containing protein [Streptomyces sp. NPDC054861]